MVFLPQTLEGQVKVDVKEKVVDETDARANDAADNAIDAGFDKIEDGIKGVFRKKDKQKKDDGEEAGEEEKEEGEGKAGAEDAGSKKNPASGPSTGSQAVLKWNKYDFVPGDKIIFEDNQQNEQNGEFPSRWDLSSGGSVENASFNDENVIYFKDDDTWIVPYIENPEKDYLPDIFTVEFDLWFEKDEYCQYYIELYDTKNQNDIDFRKLEFKPYSVNIYQLGEGIYPGAEEDYNYDESFWRHVAISFNKRAMKIYYDEARVLNIPNLTINPSGLSVSAGGFNTAGIAGINRLIKNVRIAEGGVKLYDKLIQDGKIIANGIRFDVNKATLRPESMGVINSIMTLMNEHPELTFSVEGHTDSDGDNAFNQTLSEKRARAVAEKLAEMGIDPSRLSSKGWGETKPLASNTTSEGKASNRRVEFVKL